MADDVQAPTQEELADRVLSGPIGAAAYDESVSRGENILGALRQGFTEPIVSQTGGLARLFGDVEASKRIAALQKDPNALGGGMAPVNPTMAEDFSTGIARGVGAAPFTALQAEVGLPALIGGGALSGYDAYQRQKEDYDARAAAGQLAPGEEAPSPYKEIGKGAIGNAAFLLGGMGGGLVAKGALPAIKGSAARILAAYGLTAAGNLGGEQVARVAEGKGLGFDNPAQLGESLVTGLGTFGVQPTRHLLSNPKLAYRPPKEEPTVVERAANPPSVIKTFPQLALSPMSAETAGVTTPPPLPESPYPFGHPLNPVRVGGETPPPLPESPYPFGHPLNPVTVPTVDVGPTPADIHAANTAGAELASTLVGQAALTAETIPPGEGAFTNQNRENFARWGALYEARKMRAALQGLDPNNPVPPNVGGLTRNQSIAAFNEAIRILEQGPVEPKLPYQQQIAATAGLAALGPINELRRSGDGAGMAQEIAKPDVQQALQAQGLPPIPPAASPEMPAYVRMVHDLLAKQDAEIAAAHADALKATAGPALRAKLGAPPLTPEEQAAIFAARQEAPAPQAAAGLKQQLTKEQIDAAAAAEAERQAQAAAHIEATKPGAAPALAQRLAQGKPIAEIPTPAEATQTPTTPLSNETRNVEEQRPPVGQVNGPNGPLNPTVESPGGLRRVSELGPGAQEGPVLEPGGNAPVNQVNDTGAGLRGQGELGGQPTQRPVLTPEGSALDRYRAKLAAMTPEELEAEHQANTADAIGSKQNPYWQTRLIREEAEKRAATPEGQAQAAADRAAYEESQAPKPKPLPVHMEAKDAPPPAPGEPDLVVIGCGKKKADIGRELTEAANLYTGPLFTARRGFAEAQPRPWAIVSAFHGLVAPGKKIGHYDQTISDLKPEERKLWQKQVREWVKDYFGDNRMDTVGKTIEVHAGADYVKAMNEALEGLGVTITQPQKGKGIGSQLAEYKKAAAPKPAEQPTVPESRETLLAQQKQLIAGERPAMLFPKGTKELPRPTGRGKREGIKRLETDSGVYHYNPKLITEQGIRFAEAHGRQNEILGLGPESKADVAATGEKPVVVQETTPAGVPVRDAVASEGQAPATAAELEKNKSPGNTVAVTTPEAVIADRQAAAQTPKQQAAADAQAKLDALGPEPPKPSNEKKAFGSRGKAGASPEAVARWEAETKAYNAWKRKYGPLKKAQVEASNAAFREEQAPPTQEQHVEKVATIETRIGELDQQIAADQKLADSPVFSPEVGAARDRLMKNRAAREDLAAERISMPPEPPAGEPLTPKQQAARADQQDMATRLGEAAVKRQQAEKALADLGDPRKLKGEAKQEYADAKTELAAAKNEEKFWQRKIAENEAEPPQILEAPTPITKPPDVNDKGFYSVLGRFADKLPDSLAEIPGRTVTGRTIPGREIIGKGGKPMTIPERKEADKVYPTQSVVEQFQKMAAEAKVPADELKWSGIIPWLKQQGPAVTREQIQNFIRENGTVKVDEVYFGKRPVTTPEEIARQKLRDEQTQRAVKMMEEAQTQDQLAYEAHQAAYGPFEAAKSEFDKLISANANDPNFKNSPEYKAAGDKYQAAGRALDQAGDARRKADEYKQVVRTMVRRAEEGLPERTLEELQAHKEALKEVGDQYLRGEITQRERQDREELLRLANDAGPEMAAVAKRIQKAQAKLGETGSALKLAVNKALEAKGVPEVARNAFEATMRLGDDRLVQPNNEQGGYATLAPKESAAHLAALNEITDARIAQEALITKERNKEPEQREAIYQRHMHPFAPVEGYHEIVLTKEAPKTREASRQEIEALAEKIAAENGTGFDEATESGRQRFIREAEDQIAREQKAKRGPQFQAPHFSGAGDVISNVLVDPRIDTKGRKVSFVQEGQSDRHGRGAREGYRGEDIKPEDVKVTKTEVGGWNVEYPNGDERGWPTNNGDPSDNYVLTKEQVQQRAAEYWNEHIKNQSGIPDAPFRSDHILQGIKRVLRDAIMAGKDAIGWNVGDTVNERYSLERALNKITWEHAPKMDRVAERMTPEPHTAFSVKLHSKQGGDVDLKVAKDGTVVAGHIRGNDQAGKSLAEVLGNSEIADKILKSEPLSEKEATAAREANEKGRQAVAEAQKKVTAAGLALDQNYEERPQNAITHEAYMKRVKELKAAHEQAEQELKKAEDEKYEAYKAANGLNEIDAEGLKVGGAGKRRLYDQKMLKDIGDYVAQWGGKVEKGEMPTGKRAESGEYLVKDSDGNVVDHFDTMEAATRARSMYDTPENFSIVRDRQGAIDTRPYWLVEITPEMARSIMEEGQPIAAPEPKVVAELAASYKADPKTMEAFDKDARERVLPSFVQSAQRVFGDNVRVVHDSPMTKGIGVVPTRDGGVELHVGPNWFATLAAKHGGGAREFLAKALEEEGIHIAVLKAVHEMWSKMDPATRPDFYDYNRQVVGESAGQMLREIRQLRDQGKHSEAFAIEQAVRRAKEFYDHQVGDENSMTGRQILEQAQKDPAFAYKYINEMWRQLAQIRKNGQISETTFQKIVRHLHDLYKGAQAVLERVVGGAHEGTFGENTKNILRRVEELTSQKGVEEGRVAEAPKLESPEKISHLEDNVIAWHGGADDQDARSNSRDVRGYSPRQAAADFLADSSTASTESLQPHERSVVELSKLAHFEAGRGRLIDKSAILDGHPDVVGGGEHQVFLDPKTQRWVKFTRPGASGLISEKFETDIPLKDNVSRLATRGATPAEYFERMRLANEKLGDDQQYHGVWLDRNGEPGGLVISQPHVEGRDATSSDIATTLTKAGFKRVGLETWYRPSDRLVLDDTTPRNFVFKDGKAVPIDVPARVADEAFHEEAMRQINSGKRFIKPGERNDLPFPPKPDNRQILEAPSPVERAATAVKEKIREKGRPFWYKLSKPYRRFSDALSTRVGNIETIANNEGVRVTNSLYNAYANAGSGKFGKAIFGLAGPGKDLKEAAETFFPLREAGFGTATTPEEIDTAKAKLDNFVQRVNAGLKSSNVEVQRAAEKMKPAYDRAQELIKTEDGLAQALSATAHIESETARQIADAKSRGVEINDIDDYIRRTYEETLGDNAARFVPNNSGKGGSIVNDKGFLKPRAYETAVDAMEHGLRLANLDTAQLVGHGEASVQKLIGEKALYNELRAVRSPVTDRPVITDKYEVYNDRLGEEVKRAPEGYAAIDGPGGRPIYVEQNLAPLFRALSAPSWVRQNLVGNTLLKYASGFKNGTLLFDSYHATRLAATLMGLVGQNGDLSQLHDFIKRGQAALDYRPEDLADMVKHGVIDEKTAKWALEAQKDYEIAARSGVNFGKQLDNLYESVGKPFFISILSKLGTKEHNVGEGIETFNKFVFQKQARAAMMVGFRTILERNLKRFEGSKSRTEIERMSARETNEIFGNLGRQGWIKSKTGQDIARLFMLAPAWNEGRLRFQGRALAQGLTGIVKPFRYVTTTHVDANGNVITTKKLKYQPPGNAVGTMLALSAASFAANQLINGATRGQPTWDNEDGHKMDAWVPGGKNGFFYSPLNLAAEDLHTIMKYGAKSSPLETVQRIAMNKASGLARGVAALGGVDSLGRPLPGDENRLKAAAKALAPLPIVTSAITSRFTNPELTGGFKEDAFKQGLGMVGIKLDKAESPEQRIRLAASNAFPSQFPKANSPGDFSRLRSFVSNEKVGDATKEILRLISKGKSEDDLLRSFAPTRTFSQSRAQDQLLMRSPTTAALLPAVRADRMNDFNQLRQAIALAKQSPKYQEAVIAGRATKQPVQ